MLSSTQAMADVWKRFSLQSLAYPFSLFSLLETSAQEFQTKWMQIVSTKSSCEQCLDVEFTSTLLRLFDTPPTDDLARWTQLHHKVSSLLEEVAVCCPLNTESVENKHAVSQTLFSKTRGQLKQVTTAVEDSFLDVISRSYAKLSQQVKAEEQPVRLQESLSRLGKRSRSHHSQPAGVFESGEIRSMADRVALACAKKSRRVSGRNDRTNHYLCHVSQ